MAANPTAEQPAAAPVAVPPGPSKASVETATRRDATSAIEALFGGQGSFRRTMLAIKTPVTVTLARKQESLDRILNLVPGSMLTFDIHCEEPLVLEAGGHPIATGETIKIGDKFGLRIREILDAPEEG